MSVAQSCIRSQDGALLELSTVYDSGTSGPCTFSARLKRPGDASWSAPFVPVDDSGSNLHSDGSMFDFDDARESSGRWVLTMVKDGDSTPSFWWSADDGKTWKEL